MHALYLVDNIPVIIGDGLQCLFYAHCVSSDCRNPTQTTLESDTSNKVCKARQPEFML